MPRYFFHIRQGEDLIPDYEGAEFEDLEAARVEAAHSCRDLAAQEIRDGGPVTFCKIEIWDECGRQLATVGGREISEG
jgi:hypothetical protein